MINVQELIRYYEINRDVDITPSDRKEWAMYCNALKVLGYGRDTFAALSHADSRTINEYWNKEKTPRRYVKSQESAERKIIYFARAAGVDTDKFKVELPLPERLQYAARAGDILAADIETARKVLSALEMTGSDTSLFAALVSKRLAEVKIAKPIFRSAESAEKYLHYRLSHPDRPKPTETAAVRREPDECFFIDFAEIEKSAAAVERSNLWSYLVSRLPDKEDELRLTLADYMVGATNRFVADWGVIGTSFPIIRADGKVIDSHLLPYGADGHRLKACEGKSDCSWLLTYKYHKGDRRAPWCLFGEHLAVHPINAAKPIAIVESEKSAVVASAYFPKCFVWCATLSMTNLTLDRIAAVRNRDLHLFPDSGKGIECWEQRAKEFAAQGIKVTCHSKYIADNVPFEGGDIADIILDSGNGSRID